MNPSNRIIVNTLAQYVRTIINMVLSLYSSRLVLNILGVDDYGVYSLVAGVVSMLSFLTNSLVGSTQRFLSVNQNNSDISKLKLIFSNSLLLHMLLALITSIILYIITPLLFNGFLNIPSDRLDVAKTLYVLVVIMVSVSFVAAPYRALLVSHENIVYISLIDVLDGILKVILVLVLPHLSVDKLIAYGLIMLGIQLFNLFAFSIYSHIKYIECIFPKIGLFSLSFLKELTSFTGWILYSSVCVTFRNQGVAIILNRIYGAAINAAYGIGAQLAGMLAFVGSSFNNAIAPQLMAAEGGNNRQKMLSLAEAQSKFSFLLMSMFGIPAMFEMRTILGLWLVEVPDHTVVFGCMFLSMQIVDMLSTGLASANRAIGNIGKYTIYTYTPKLVVLPIAWILLKFTDSLILLAFLMFAVEALCMFLRIYLYRLEQWFNIHEFIKSVVYSAIFPVLGSTLVCFLCDVCIRNNIMCLFTTFSSSVLIFIILTYFFSFNQREKFLFKNMLSKFLK